MLFTDGMLQRLVEPFMFSQANLRILALVLMTALPYAALGTDEDARAKQLDAILAKSVTSGQPALAFLLKKHGDGLFQMGAGPRRGTRHEHLLSPTVFHHL